MIDRQISQLLAHDAPNGKISLIVGPRQVGKTTLLEQLRQGRERVLVLNCDNADEAAILEDKNSTELRTLLAPYAMVQIDEAQRVRDIGLVLKKIGDLHLDTPVLVTGSSALDLAEGIFDSAVGRVWDYHMFPFSLAELAAATGPVEQTLQLQRRMVFGLYPEVVNRPADERETLRHIYNHYLYRDVLAYRGMKKPEVLQKLVRALALQVGSEVSYNELANLLGIDKETVENYIELLEKCFVLFRLPSFSRNLRNEIKKGKKIYFYDNGIRNAAIDAFAPLDSRNDVGALWENLMVSERVKRNAYTRAYGKLYFWRTHQQKEIDLIEEYDGRLHAFEFKWNPKAKAPRPLDFARTYPRSTFEVVHPNNFWSFVQ